MMKELQTWVKHQNIPRKPRKQARNFIDTRGAMEWKYEPAATSVEDVRAGKRV